MSISKKKATYIRSLKEKKYRTQHNTFVAEGSKLIFDLIANTRCQLLIVSEELEGAIPKVETEEDIIFVSRQEIKKISNLTTPPDSVAVFYQASHDYVTTDYLSKLNLVLDDIQDPGNLGTIIRVADWFGIENIFCSRNTVDVYNSKTVQATMGAIARVKTHYLDLEKFLIECSNNNLMPIYGTFLDGNNIYNEPLSNKGFIIMGNEGKGINPQLEKLINNRLYIPNFSIQTYSSESLNVAVATAIVCSEFRRR